MLTSDLMLWLVVAGIVAAGLLGFFVYAVFPLYVRDAYAPLRRLVATHDDLELVGWEPHVTGTWRGHKIHYRVTLEHGAAERFDYRTGATTTVDVHVPDDTPLGEPPIPEDRLPPAAAIAPDSVDHATIFAAPMGFVFQMGATLESVEACAELLDDLVAIAEEDAASRRRP